MRYILSFLISAVAMTAHADAFQFYAKRFNRAAQAASTFHLKIAGGLNCTGVYIGPNGEALTNLHCVEQCLLDAAVTTSQPLESIDKNLVMLAKPVTCASEILVDGKLQTLAIQVRHVFGPGFLSPRDSLGDFQTKYPDQFKSLLQDGFEGCGDLVLLQVPRAGACVRLADADLSGTVPADAFNLSYAVVWRQKEHSSPVESPWFATMGTTLLFTQGSITSNASTIAAQFASSTDLDYVRMNMGPGTFLSTLDAEGGSSGSPVFNAQGGLIGLLRSMFKPPFTEYRPWMTEGIDLTPFGAELRELVPDNAQCDSQG